MLCGAETTHHTLDKRSVLFSSPIQTALACIACLGPIQACFTPTLPIAHVRSIFSLAKLSPGKPYIVKSLIIKLIYDMITMLILALLQEYPYTYSPIFQILKNIDIYRYEKFSDIDISRIEGKTFDDIYYGLHILITE